MKKIALVAAALVVTLNAGAAFAENPYVGEPESLAAQDKTFVSMSSRKAIKEENFANAKCQPNVDHVAPAAAHQADNADYRSNFGNH